MAEVEAALAAKVLAKLPRDAGFADVADRLQLQSWLDEPRLVTHTLARLARTDSLPIALHILSYMQSQQIEANAFHYTAVIAGCAHSGAWEIAGGLLQQMVEQQIQRDEMTFNSAINACGKGAQWETSLSLLDCMGNSKLTLGTDTMNSVMGACTRASEWERALGIFNDLNAVVPDVISFSSALAACDKGSQWRTALSLLDSSVSSAVQLDHFGYSSAISSTSQWEVALGLWKLMLDRAVKPDVVTHGSILKALAAGQQWAMALWFLFSATVVTPVTCNSAMNACGGQWRHACWLLYSMPSLQISPEDVSYNTAISACVRGTCWQQGLVLFTEMFEALVEPDRISFNSALSACQKGNEWQLALKLMEQISSYSLQADEFCFTTLLSACEVAGWERCLSVLNDLNKKVNLTPVMFGVQMSACERDGAWAAALSTLEAIMASDLIPDALHVGSAANAVRKGQDVEAAWRLLEKMKSLWSQSWDQEIQQPFPGLRWSTNKVVRQGPGVLACLKPAGIATEDFVEELAVELEVVPEAFTIVSRLDHPTSGILMVALGLQGSPSANWLQVQFASRLVDKKYICLCEGLPLGPVGATGDVFAPLCADEVQGCMVVPEAEHLGRAAWTKYRVLARYSAAADQELMLLEVKPITGRTHQIRVHMAHLGRPLVGDLTYGAKELSILQCERLFLHCRRVQLRDFSDQKFGAVASLPTELREVLAKLRLKDPRMDKKKQRKRPRPTGFPTCSKYIQISSNIIKYTVIKYQSTRTNLMINHGTLGLWVSRQEPGLSWESLPEAAASLASNLHLRELQQCWQTSRRWQRSLWSPFMDRRPQSQCNQNMTGGKHWETDLSGV